jgi:hypothetical protein
VSGIPKRSSTGPGRERKPRFELPTQYSGFRDGGLSISVHYTYIGITFAVNITTDDTPHHAERRREQPVFQTHSACRAGLEPTPERNIHEKFIVPDPAKLSYDWIFWLFPVRFHFPYRELWRTTKRDALLHAAKWKLSSTENPGRVEKG